VILAVTAALITLAAINTITTTWTTAQEARPTMAIARTLGATPGQITAGLSTAQLLPTLPGALAGICWILLISHTTLNVPSLTGAIMCMGVATANSILMVSFAREQMAEGKNAREAALEAGFVRIRPVLMTALAMVIGMVPMAIGLGEGGEQNAPLGRAVIGGLLFATLATLFFVPCVFSMIHSRIERKRGRPALA